MNFRILCAINMILAPLHSSFLNPAITHYYYKIEKKIELRSKDIGMVLKKSDKIGTGYESLHIMDYILSLQFLQVDVVLVGVVLRFA